MQDAAEREAELRESSLQALARRTRHDSSSSSSSASSASPSPPPQSRKREPAHNSRFNETVVVRGRVVGGSSRGRRSRSRSRSRSRNRSRSRSRSLSRGRSGRDRDRSPQGEKRRRNESRSRSPERKKAKKDKREKKERKKDKKGKKDKKDKKSKKAKKEGKDKDKDKGGDRLVGIDREPKTLEDFAMRMAWLRAKGTLVQKEEEMDAGEAQEGGTVKRKDLRDIYGKISRPDVIGDLGALGTEGTGGIFGVLGAKGKFSNTKPVGHQAEAKVEAAVAGEQGGEKKNAERTYSEAYSAAAGARPVEAYVGSKLAKEIQVTVPKVEGQAVGGAMTLDQWRAMREQVPFVHMWEEEEEEE